MNSPHIPPQAGAPDPVHQRIDAALHQLAALGGDLVAHANRIGAILWSPPRITLVDTPGLATLTVTNAAATERESINGFEQARSASVDADAAVFLFDSMPRTDEVEFLQRPTDTDARALATPAHSRRPPRWRRWSCSICSTPIRPRCRCRATRCGACWS